MNIGAESQDASNEPARKTVNIRGKDVCVKKDIDEGLKTDFDIDMAINSPQFQDWCERIGKDEKINIDQIDMQSMDIFDDDEVGIVKFKAHAKVDGKDVPGTVFSRGRIDAILVILAVKKIASNEQEPRSFPQCKGDSNVKYAVVIRQPYLALGRDSLAELPTGRFENTYSKGQAVEYNSKADGGVGWVSATVKSAERDGSRIELDSGVTVTNTKLLRSPVAQKGRSVTFQPGAIGFKFSAGTVTQIEKEGQAQRCGVKEGDVIKAVDHVKCNSFTDKVFLDAKTGKTPFIVTFETKALSNPIEYDDDDNFWDQIRKSLGRPEENEDVIWASTGKTTVGEMKKCNGDDLKKMFPISVSLQDAPFVGKAADLLKRHLGISIWKNDPSLQCLSELVYGKEEETNVPGIFPGCGSFGEIDHLWLYRKDIDQNEWNNLGLAHRICFKSSTLAQEKMINLEIVEFDTLWQVSPDTKTLCALALYDECLETGKLPSIYR